jgi:hypothetical protein
MAKKWFVVSHPARNGRAVFSKWKTQTPLSAFWGGAFYFTTKGHEGSRRKFLDFPLCPFVAFVIEPFQYLPNFSFLFTPVLLSKQAGCVNFMATHWRTATYGNLF